MLYTLTLWVPTNETFFVCMSLRSFNESSDRLIHSLASLIQNPHFYRIRAKFSWHSINRFPSYGRVSDATSDILWIIEKREFRVSITDFRWEKPISRRKFGPKNVVPHLFRRPGREKRTLLNNARSTTTCGFSEPHTWQFWLLT